MSCVDEPAVAKDNDLEGGHTSTHNAFRVVQTEMAHLQQNATHAG